MENTKKPIKNFNWGVWNISEWENTNSEGKNYTTFTLSKNVYNIQEKKLERVGSININKKEDFSKICYIFEKSKETLKEMTLMNYGIRFNSEGDKITGKFLVKFYKDKNGNEAVQQISLEWIDLLDLKDLVNAFNFHMIIEKNKNIINSQQYNEENNNFADKVVDDTIPF